MDVLLYKILYEVNWYLAHERSRIMPISYKPKLKEMVRAVIDSDRDRAAELLIELEQTHEDKSDG